VKNKSTLIVTFIGFSIMIAACAPAPSTLEINDLLSPTAIQVPSADITPAMTPASPEPAPTEEQVITTVVELPDADGYSWELIADGFNRPINLAKAGDGSGRLFVIEQQGVIRTLLGGQILADPFLDIRDRVGSRANEQGLLGATFYPNFKENGHVFVNYTDRSGNTVIARFTVQPASEPAVQAADPSSEKIILRVEQPYANHNGGHLLFGPDGMLWIGLGDGGSGGDPKNNGQSLQTLLGKILRIDVDNGDPYAIPTDNPFANSGGLPEIWAYGLRNPWGLTFDPQTGDLYIADVGQNAWEEIDHVPGGYQGPALNFGWRIMEGSHPFNQQNADPSTALTAPVFEYGHD
jgi:glucose/arabinose dehydrogenase